MILLYFLWIIVLQYRQAPGLYRPLFTGIIAIITGSCFLFLLAGIVSSALEIFFTVSMTWMVYGLYKNMTAGDGVS